MVTRTVELPWTGQCYTVVMPADIDPLLDRVAPDPEQNLPYWAELWPSGIALADLIEQDPAVLRGRRVIELGCGLGASAIAALRAGAELMVTDYAPEALALCQLNAVANTGLIPEAAAFNWRRADAALQGGLAGSFDVVLAADVLYERRDIAPLMQLMRQLLVPGGWLWLAEPGRPVAAEFLIQMRADDGHWQSRQHVGPWPDAADEGVAVGLHRFAPI